MLIGGIDSPYDSTMKTRSVLALSVMAAFSVALIYFTLERANLNVLIQLHHTPGQLHEPAGTSGHSVPSIVPSRAAASVTSPHTPALPSGTCRGFVVVETYTNQLSAALLGYLQLARVTDSLNMGVVEPFVFQSKLFGLPNQRANVSVPQLSEYFDLRAFQDLLHQCSVLHHPDAHIFSFHDFLVQSSRNLVRVHIRRSDHPRKVHVCRNTTSVSRIERKINTHVNTVREQATKLHGMEGYNFTVIKSLCIEYNPRSPISLKGKLTRALELVSQVLTSRSNTASLILTGSWGLVSPLPALYSIYDPSITLQNYNCNITLLPHTELVRFYASEFFHSLNLSRPIIAVHLRFEQLFKSAFKVFQTTIAYYNKCLIRVRHLLEHLVGVSSRGGHTKGIFVRDMKEYGSNSAKIHPQVEKHSQLALRLLDYVGLKEVQFDPSDPQFRGAPTEQTFVALVEQEALTMVDTLVLIGGGRYQEHMADRFLLTHSRKDIHFLCTRNVTVTVL